MPIRDWQIDFGPISGTPGLITTITVRPQNRFRGEKAMATDTSSSPGRGTRIRSIYVEQKLQRPALTDTLTIFFAETVLANGIRWDWCGRGCAIAVTVSFVEAVEFSMTVFGSAEGSP